jgi:hypothetical protein
VKTPLAREKTGSGAGAALPAGGRHRSIAASRRPNRRLLYVETSPPALSDESEALITGLGFDPPNKLRQASDRRRPDIRFILRAEVILKKTSRS